MTFASLKASVTTNVNAAAARIAAVARDPKVQDDVIATSIVSGAVMVTMFGALAVCKGLASLTD